jgi:serine/threonine-protein kinase RsbW
MGGDMIESAGHGFHRVMRVKAETARLAEIRRFVEEVALEAALDTERVFDLKVAVSEACANAVEHAGCEAVPLEVCAQLHARRLTFIVTDAGLFHPPSPPRENSQSRGLGLPLMVALMDEVSFARVPGGGTTVSLSVLLDRGAAVSA